LRGTYLIGYLNDIATIYSMIYLEFKNEFEKI
jgi:hypothetical protein